MKAAAKKAGVSERTLYKWLKKPAFAQRVARLRAALVDEAIGALSKDVAAAAKALRALVKSKDEDVKLKAARAVLELGIKLREHGELERRLLEVEAKLGVERGDP